MRWLQLTWFARSVAASCTEPPTAFTRPLPRWATSILSKSGEAKVHTVEMQPPNPSWDRFEVDGTSTYLVL